MKIEFEFQTPHGLFKDALYFPDDQVPDDATLEQMKQARLQLWLERVTTPPIEPEYVDIDGVLYVPVDINGTTVLKPV